jgi:hypothetical protein
VAKIDKKNWPILAHFGPFWPHFMNLNHVLKKIGRTRAAAGDLFKFWCFLNLHALGYPKSVTKNFCAHFWVTRSLSMMWPFYLFGLVLFVRKKTLISGEPSKNCLLFIHDYMHTGCPITYGSVRIGYSAPEPIPLHERIFAVSYFCLRLSAKLRASGIGMTISPPSPPTHNL